jgi:hypothetical protein
MANYNKIITTVNSVTSDYTFVPDQDNLIVIDTSNNRIGINTVNPEHSIDISNNGTVRASDFYINDISLSAKINEIITFLNGLTPPANIVLIPDPV